MLHADRPPSASATFPCPRCGAALRLAPADGDAPPPPPHELLTTREAAQLLGVSVMTVYRLYYRKLLKKTKVGGGTRWRRSVLERFLDRFTRKSK
jgi:excisionase family DNA binding protein